MKSCGEWFATELTTLKAAAWRNFTVEGAVEPSPCNFSACAVGNRVALFGGEEINLQPMNDTFVLDLNSSNIELHCCSMGCERQSLLTDVVIQNLDAKHPAWREISSLAPPLPRSWHSSCTLIGPSGLFLVVVPILEYF
ncbi:unnamed protein product [Fraxinus pennsylvanica]|uniref:Uncharacterized protein n=1 Tax=Fraxinus pennsylvanica TaxID=56036 RepID=A0AAD2E8N0_9LAMI|nr:unnamed protein product [Fraxinus pennsylvanica]